MDRDGSGRGVRLALGRGMLRALAAVVVLLSACTEHGESPPPGNQDPPPPPPDCGCFSDTFECCANVVCSFDEEANQWIVVVCDDDLVPPDPCDRCAIGAGE